MIATSELVFIGGIKMNGGGAKSCPLVQKDRSLYSF